MEILFDKYLAKYKKKFGNIIASNLEKIKFSIDLNSFMNSKLNASLIHLIFAHVHPYMDGKGRAARLLEKWFISGKPGEIAWEIRSEKYYFENGNKYYENINSGPDYYELNYQKCFPFLEMILQSQQNKIKNHINKS